MSEHAIPDRLVSLHRGEECLRGDALERVAADACLALHLRVVENAMDLAGFLRQVPTEDEDMKVIQVLGIRACNAFGAGLKLALSGYTQSSVLIMRDILETVFLLTLFRRDRTPCSSALHHYSRCLPTCRYQRILRDHIVLDCEVNSDNLDFRLRARDRREFGALFDWSRALDAIHWSKSARVIVQTCLVQSALQSRLGFGGPSCLHLARYYPHPVVVCLCVTSCMPRVHICVHPSSFSENGLENPRQF